MPYLERRGWEAGVWLVLPDLSWDAQTLLGPPPLTAALKTAVVDARVLKGTRNKETALRLARIFHSAVSFCTNEERKTKRVFSILKIARNNEEI